MKFNAITASVEGDLLALAAVGGPEARELMERLIPALEPILQKQMIDIATGVATELALQLPHMSVEPRLIEGGVELSITSSEPFNLESGSEQDARITLRLPAALKERIEISAASEGISLNAWLLKTLQKNSFSPITIGRQLRGRGQS